MRHIILFITILSLSIISIPILAINVLSPLPPTQGVAVSAQSTTVSLPDLTSIPIKKVQPSEEYFLILDESTGKISKVSAFDYALGALAAEMPPSFHPQALAAQACAAYTRGLYCKQAQSVSPDPSLKGADFSAIPSQDKGYITPQRIKEIYGDSYALFYPAMKDAAQFGSSHKIVFENEPILAAYHAISAQQTEYCKNVWDQDMEYLVGVESQGDSLAPNFETTVKFSPYRLKCLLESAFHDAVLKAGDEGNWIIPSKRSPGGYVLEVDVGGVTTTGKEIRKALDLRSACFSVSFENGEFVFTVKGYGHGVGLSQYGADFMGRQGSSASEILEYYYKGASVVPSQQQ